MSSSSEHKDPKVWKACEECKELVKLRIVSNSADGRRLLCTACWIEVAGKKGYPTSDEIPPTSS